MSPQNTLDIAYLVLAHQHSEQLSRLVEQLRSPAADMFVHVDAKAPIEPFLQAAGPDVQFTSTRIPVYWADYSQIRAVLLLIEAALAAPRKYDYLVLLSGVDYPLRSAAEIEDFFAQNKGSEFINWVAMPSAAASKPLSRLTDYHGRPGLRGRLLSKVRRLLIKLHFMPSARDCKAYLGETAPYAGSTWWALTRDACEYIQSFAIGNPRFMKFFENTSSPDEMVFQTILANSPFHSRMRRNLTYADWSDGAASPTAIGERHLALFGANPVLKADAPYGSGEYLVCRKALDATLSDRLGATICARNATPLERDL